MFAVLVIRLNLYYGEQRLYFVGITRLQGEYRT